jgi:hypothetical protein
MDTGDQRLDYALNHTCRFKKTQAGLHSPAEGMSNDPTIDEFIKCADQDALIALTRERSLRMPVLVFTDKLVGVFSNAGLNAVSLDQDTKPEDLKRLESYKRESDGPYATWVTSDKEMMVGVDLRSQVGITLVIDKALGTETMLNQALNRVGRFTDQCMRIATIAQLTDTPDEVTTRQRHT